MFAWIAEKKVFEVGTTNRENEFMCGKVVFSTRDCHVNKLFLMAQVFSKLEKTLVVVLPPEKNRVNLMRFFKQRKCYINPMD